MKFLDSTGLAHFWSKIKVFFIKTEGASAINMDDDNNGLSVNHDGSANTILTPSGFVSYNYEGDDEIMVARLQYGDLLLSKIHLKNGTSSQILIADGSTKTINAANGICGLDSKGNVPLSQLGNLDTTVAEVVTALPTTNIKKHIYLIKDTGGVTQNQYEEYIYTGNTSATYDASKWEKLGDFRATVDLADYAKKSETLSNLVWEQRGSDLFLAITTGDGHHVSEAMPNASSSTTGAMSNTDKVKLDGIEAKANNYSLPLATAATRGGIKVGYVANGRNYPVEMAGEKAYVNVPWTDTNTTYDLSPYAKKVETVDFSTIRVDKKTITSTPQGLIEKQVILFTSLGGNSGSIELEEATSNMSGLMSIRDKNKLSYIADGATADSAITTAEIDALFA
jgi:hypothetical protein